MFNAFTFTFSIFISGPPYALLADVRPSVRGPSVVYPVLSTESNRRELLITLIVQRDVAHAGQLFIALAIFFFFRVLFLLRCFSLFDLVAKFARVLNTCYTDGVSYCSSDNQTVA